MKKIYLPLIFFLFLRSICDGQEVQLPQPIKDFVYSSLGLDLGKRNKRSPEGLEQFGQLVGVWEMTSHKLHQGTWYSGWTAYWAWKYALGGSVIQDYYFHPKENLPPTAANQDFDTQGFNLRIYDSESNSWHLTWASNNGPKALYSARQEGDEIWMSPLDKDKPEHRIIFSEIRENSFKWTRKHKNEQGDWVFDFYLVGKRIL
ncbi:MAG: hypothetical protein AAFU64_03340 [Bacteroidota bacterium]